MSEATIVKLIYGTIALLAGITVGVVVATFLSILRFFEVLISFPWEIYKTLVQSYRTRLMMEAFSIQQSSEDKENECSDSEKMWDRHIARMKNKEDQSTKND